MDITISKQSENAEVRLTGRFDAHATPEVSEAFESLLQEELFQLSVDLQETVFIDSTALASLVKTMKSARSAGGDLIISNPSQPVTIILKLTGLDKAFKINSERRKTNKNIIIG